MKKIMLILTLLSLVMLLSGVTVYDIQYTEDPSGDSPLVGQIVEVSGIVTASNYYSSGNSNRFFLSDPEGGAWHGIFCFNWDFEVETGDEVEFTAEVSEYYNFTELINLADLTIISSGNPVPAALEVTTDEVSQSEAYEGVLVQVNNVTVTQEPDNYGQSYIDDGSGECQVDDGIYDFAPALGDQFGFIRGVVDYSYDEFGINPRDASDIGFSGEPGYIEGLVTLNGGSGNVEDVVVSAEGYSASPDDSGEYELELPPGTYDVTASLNGYSSQTINDVLVEEDETTSGIDFTLEPAAETTIYDIQFTEDPSGDSPLAGQTVTVTGIVTGAGFSGQNFFFLSSEEGGAWNGVYVYQYDYEVNQGDNVTLTATVSEYYGFTELASLSALTINSSGNTLPEPVEISTAELAASEAYEGVLVKITNPEVITLPDPETYNEWYVDDGSGQCQMEDGFDAIYPEMAVGDVFNSITGLVDYSYDEYGLHPRNLGDYDSGQGPDITPIYDIQFTEDPSGDSPLAGQTVTVEAIVAAAEYMGNKYFLTSEDGGAWNGIYVYDTANSPAAGDMVQITAEVAEYYNFTELTNVSAFNIVSSANPLPASATIETGEEDLEAYESVFVKIQNVTVTQAPDAEYGEWYVDDGTGEMQIDDGFFFLDEVEPPIVIEQGMVIPSISGILDYSFSEFGLNPRFPEDINLGNPALNNEISPVINLQVYPNPFYNSSSRSHINFSFDLQQDSKLELTVYNIKGQKVSQIAQGYYPAGNHSLSWNAETGGNKIPAGVYFYHLKSDSCTSQGKLLLLR